VRKAVPAQRVEVKNDREYQGHIPDCDADVPDEAPGGGAQVEQGSQSTHDTGSAQVRWQWVTAHDIIVSIIAFRISTLHSPWRWNGPLPPMKTHPAKVAAVACGPKPRSGFIT
jgi:hypothetical protein